MIGPTAFAVVATLFIGGGLALVGLRPVWVIDRPGLVLAVLSLVTLGAGASLVRTNPLGFTIDVDPASEPLLRRDDPARPVYERATRDFGNDDVYLVVMESDDVFTRENLETLRRLTDAMMGLPGVAAVESLTRVLSIEYDPERDLIGVSDFIDEIPDEPDALAELRRRALADRLYRKTIVSRDGRAAAINVTFRPMTDAEFVDLDIDGSIARLIERERREGVHFYVAGRPHVRARAYHLMVDDTARLLPVAVAVAAVVLWFMAGSLRGVLIPLVNCMAATLWVFGAMGATRTDINLITLVLGSMMICIGSVYGVHVFARYEVIADLAVDRRDAALRSLVYARTPVLLAGFTTCIGFGALLLTDIPATNELGAFSILGVASVTLLSLTGVPAVLARMPPRSAAERHRRRATRWFESRLDALLERIAALAVHRSGAVLVFWGVLTAAAAVAIPRIVIDTDVITFFLEGSSVRRDFAAVNRLLTGALPIYVVVAGEQEGEFREPATLRAVEALEVRLSRLPGVSEVLSSVDLVRMANRAINANAEDADRIPDSRAAVAEATFLVPKAKLRRFQTSNHSRTNLVVRTGQSGSAAMRALEARIRAVLRDSDLPARFTTAVTGNAILLNRSADDIAGNQATQVGFAAAAIFALIGFAFRSLRLALISMVPNVVPVVIFFGILGVGAAPLSLPTSLIGSIALGIAIDDTMHFLVAYRFQRERGFDPDAAVQHCLRQVGRPIVMTSIMLVVGFLVILTSGFATLREFGALTALTMAICLATDLVLFPALLVRARV